MALGKLDNQAAAVDIELPLKGHRSALTLLVLAFTLSIADRMILSILFPDIKAEFGLSDMQLGLLGGLTFALFYATLGIPIARLADQYNRKIILIVCLVLFSVMTALSGFASGFIMLLLLRIGVGVGEAGVNPSSHSIIADYFPAHRRAFAMAILMVGANLGMMLGFAGGGFIAEHYGWRVALMAMGIPGLLLAAVMAYGLKEPARGSFEGPGSSLESTPVLHTALAMWRNLAMRHLIIASIITGMISYGFTQWLPTFFVRSHHMAQSDVGAMMALFFGILGVAGALIVGKLADRLAPKGFQYGVWLICGLQLLAIPFWFFGISMADINSVLWLLVIPAFVSNSYLGPSLALIQTLSPVGSRAVASAIKMLCLNLIGLGLGPLMVGSLSDWLQPVHGDGSLAIALSSFSLLGIWAALHFFLCGRALAQSHVQ